MHDQTLYTHKNKTAEGIFQNIIVIKCDRLQEDIFSLPIKMIKKKQKREQNFKQQ